MSKVILLTFKFPATVSMNRVAHEKVILSDGTVIPKGAHTCVFQMSAHTILLSTRTRTNSTAVAFTTDASSLETTASTNSSRRMIHIYRSDMERVHALGDFLRPTRSRSCWHIFYCSRISSFQMIRDDRKD